MFVWIDGRVLILFEDRDFHAINLSKVTRNLKSEEPRPESRSLSTYLGSFSPGRQNISHRLSKIPTPLIISQFVKPIK